MLSNRGIDTNLRFLVLEVRKQLQRTQRYLGEPSDDLLAEIVGKDDYIDNLRSVIQRKCYAQVAMLGDAADPEVDVLKGLDVISANLERVADFCGNVVNQAHHLGDLGVLRAQPLDSFFAEVMAGLDQVEEAALERKVEVALQICSREDNLDHLYGGAFRSLLAGMDEDNAASRVTSIFILHYFERMGDALLNIGEAVISLCLGERIKISRFWALRDATGATGGVKLEPVADTRSGSKISRVRPAADGRALILKEGARGKLADERRNIERWHHLVPGLAPQIHSFHQYGDSAATLFEYLPGSTFEELLLRGDAAELEAAMTAICGVLGRIWTETRRPEPARARFLDQLRRRLPDVLQAHPEFERAGYAIGSVSVRAFGDLVRDALPLDDRLAAPFSVFIHGDFNVDNVIYDAASGGVHFVDLHRSAQSDWVQDVSVFLVSTYRLQALGNPLQGRLSLVTQRFYAFARAFAAEHGDASFEQRLCLGIARSLVTSTRFVLDDEMARAMFLRARYLIERLLDHADEADFEVGTEVFDD